MCISENISVGQTRWGEVRGDSGWVLTVLWGGSVEMKLADILAMCHTRVPCNETFATFFHFRHEMNKVNK